MSDESVFERQARELLRESVEQVDGATRSRLTRARHAALAEVGKPAAQRRPQWLLPAGAAAAAATAVVAVLLWNSPAMRQPGGSAAMDDLELLADVEGYELSQEPDLEFIEWAAGVGGPPTGI
jgi:hypothetical protein